MRSEVVENLRQRRAESAGRDTLSQLTQLLQPLRAFRRRGLLILGRADTLSLIRQLLPQKSQQRLSVGSRQLRYRRLEFC